MLPHIIDGLNELSSKKLQTKFWLFGGTHGISSFTEAICGIYDDGGVTRALDRGSLQEPLLTLFKELSTLLKEIPENTSQEEIMSHPTMESVKKISLELLKFLQSGY